MFYPMLLEAHAAQRQDAALSSATRYRQRRVARRARETSRAARWLRPTTSRTHLAESQPVALPGDTRQERSERRAA